MYLAREVCSQVCTWWIPKGNVLDCQESLNFSSFYAFILVIFTYSLNLYTLFFFTNFYFVLHDVLICYVFLIEHNQSIAFWLQNGAVIRVPKLIYPNGTLVG